MITMRFFQLFYYVARWRGVSEAAKKMSHGIQQPAVSRQMIELEQQLGAPLFHRRPFQLTPEGETLYAFVKPFFDGIPEIIEKLRNGAPDLIRLAASPVVLRDYLPSIFRTLEQKFPRLRFTLRAGLHSQVEKWVQAQEIDLAVMVREGKPPPGCVSESLIHLPLVLLVRKDSPLRSAEQLWAMDRISETLISPAEDDVVTRHFRQGLAKRSVEWNIGLQMDSFDLIEFYVSEGFGIGLSVAIPGRERAAGLRALPLEGFASLDVAMIWQRNPNPVVLALIAELRRTARGLTSSRAGKTKTP